MEAERPEQWETTTTQVAVVNNDRGLVVESSSTDPHVLWLDLDGVIISIGPQEVSRLCLIFQLWLETGRLNPHPLIPPRVDGSFPPSGTKGSPSDDGPPTKAP